MQSESELLESLKCPVCIDYAEDPLECQFCNHIFCRKCIACEQSRIKLNSCPMCRKESNFKESAFAKRLLGNLPVSCPKECGTNLSRNELNAHLIKCPNKNFSCGIQGCNFEHKKTEFIQHILTQHENEILKKFEKNIAETKTPMLSQSVLVQMDMLNLNNSGNINNNNNINGRLFNSRGNVVTLGDNSMHYCGKKTEFNCGCCDGNCGPENGCCCKACMDLNRQLKNLQIGIMLNKVGRKCKWTRCSFFCGVEFEKETKNILQKIFMKRLKCEYPNETCPECHTLTKNMKFYLTIDEIRNLPMS
jgi:hypothetical protein